MALSDIRKKFQPVIKEKQAVGVMLSGEEGHVYIPTGRVLQMITENIDGKEIKTARISYNLSPPSLKAAKGKTKNPGICTPICKAYPTKIIGEKLS